MVLFIVVLSAYPESTEEEAAARHAKEDGAGNDSCDGKAEALVDGGGAMDEDGGGGLGKLHGRLSEDTRLELGFFSGGLATVGS